MATRIPRLIVTSRADAAVVVPNDRPWTVIAACGPDYALATRLAAAWNAVVDTVTSRDQETVE